MVPIFQMKKLKSVEDKQFDQGCAASKQVRGTMILSQDDSEDYNASVT